MERTPAADDVPVLLVIGRTRYSGRHVQTGSVARGTRLYRVALILFCLVAAFPSNVRAADSRAPGRWDEFAQGPGSVPTAGAGAFGHVVNTLGQGIGGITITATAADGRVLRTAVCPSPPSDGAATGPVAGTCVRTGLWIINGLPPETTITFTISGPGLAVANVRPSLSIVRTTTAVGTWVDASWVVMQTGRSGFIPLPALGSTLIRGTVVDSQGSPVTGPGAFVVLYASLPGTVAGSTAFVGPTPRVRGPGDLVEIQPGALGADDGLRGTPVAAAALDAGGSYCFGFLAVVLMDGQSSCLTEAPPGSRAVHQPLLPSGVYVVTVVDDRPTSSCPPGFVRSARGSGPILCGHRPWTSGLIVAQPDRIVTVNAELEARSSPSANTDRNGSPQESAGAYGVIWNGGAPGGTAVPDQDVYAVPVSCPATRTCVSTPIGVPIPPSGINASTLAGGGIALLDALKSFAGSVDLAGPGMPVGTQRSMLQDPTPRGGDNRPPPVAPSDLPGAYVIAGLIPGATYALIVEVPEDYDDCRPNLANVLSATGDSQGWSERPCASGARSWLRLRHPGIGWPGWTSCSP